MLGRAVNRRANLPALAVTFVSMGIGAILLLALGLTTQGLGALTARSWLLIAWLAVVNTALAFTLWNHVLALQPCWLPGVSRDYRAKVVRSRPDAKHSAAVIET
jgi:drug/metabolite transporter (DMT)-like permease